MTHVTCRLTAKNRDQLRNPTLGNRVWPTFTFTLQYNISLDGMRYDAGDGISVAASRATHGAISHGAAAPLLNLRTGCAKTAGPQTHDPTSVKS